MHVNCIAACICKKRGLLLRACVDGICWLFTPASRKRRFNHLPLLKTMSSWSTSRLSVRILSIFCAFTFTCFSADAQNLLFAKGLTNSQPQGSSLVINSIRADAAGNTYVTGYFSLTADFDPGPGTVNLVATAGNRNMFFAKYDASGNYIFAKAITGADIIGSGISVDQSGNIYITGYFQGSADFDPGSGIVTKTSFGSTDILIAKYSATGDFIYVNVVGGIGRDFGYAIAVDPLGNTYVTGTFSSTVDFDLGPGVAALPAATSNDVFIVKYDPNGNFIYLDGISGPEHDEVTSIAIDNSGQVYITGNFRGTSDFDPGAGVQNLTSAGIADIYIAKYDAQGKYIYAKAIGGTDFEFANSLALDGSGNVFITGGFSGTVDFDPGAGTSVKTASDVDMFFARYDASGNLLFAKSVGGTSAENGRGIAVDANGNIIITGIFSNTVDFDPGAGVANLTSPQGSDIFLARYDASGNYLFAKSYPATGYDYGTGVTTDALNNIYFAAAFSGTTDLDAGAGVFSVTSGSSPNSFFSKLTSDGTFTWGKLLGRHDGTALTDQGRSITLDATGNMYVTGQFQGTVDFDHGPGTANLTSVGESDIFFAKYDAAGNYLFARSMGGIEADAGTVIKVDGSGNIFITGTFTGTADLNPGAGTQLLYGAGATDVFFAKYSPAGDLIFAKAISGYSTEVPNGMCIDGSGNIYLAGTFRGGTDFDPGAAYVGLGSIGGTDVFFAKYNNAGNLIFAKSFGGTGNEEGTGIAIDAALNIYLSGSFSGTVDFDPDAQAIYYASNGLKDGFFSKFNAAGTFVYCKRIGGTGDDDVTGLSLDAAGSIFLTGTYFDMVDFDPGAAVASLTSAGYFDPYIAKYDNAGNYVFAKSIGGTGFDYSSTLTVDPAGNIYAMGYFGNSVDLDPGAGTSYVYGAGHYDIYLAKYNNAGNYLWGRAMGGSDHDQGFGLAADGAGNVFLTGFFMYDAVFTRSNGDAYSAPGSINYYDIFIAGFGTLNTLPITLTSFSATPVNNGNSVNINWIVASQFNNDYFEIERSSDGAVFQTIGSVPGCAVCTTSKKYGLVDNNPVPGRSYYRMKQVDVDNKTSYSAVVAIDIVAKQSSAISVYPAITSNSFNVIIKEVTTKKRQVVILSNSTGAVIEKRTIDLNTGINTISFSLQSQGKGVYYIETLDSNGRRLGTARVVKN